MHSIYFIHLLCFQDGLTALQRAVIGKKQAITNYLLRNSANPFVQDKVSKKQNSFCAVVVACEPLLADVLNSSALIQKSFIL